MGRREDIAEAGIRCIARAGARALTHRAVDAEAGLPPGSTTYYAKTRRDLQRLVSDGITAQLEADLGALALPDKLDSAAAADVAVGFLERLEARRDAQAARLALLLELRGDEDARRPLTDVAPVRRGLESAAVRILDALHIPDPAHHAADFVGLVDALLLYRTADAGRIDAASILGAYLHGIQRRPQSEW